MAGVGLAGTNLEQARGYNRRVVLQAVRLHGPQSRADLVRRTALSVQTVANIAEELCGLGLLREQRRPVNGRGAPAGELALNPEGGFTVGISVDHRRACVLLVDLAGQVRARAVQEIAASEPEQVQKRIARLVRRMTAQAGIEDGRLWGAGIVLPGLFERGSLVRFGPSSVPGWSGYPVAERLSAELEIPVLTDNDATAAAVGEHLYGAGHGLTDFFYVYVGAGIGGGMVLAGHPYRGSGHAGEFGHLVVEPDGRPCSCGNRGCLERYASLSSAMAALTGRPEGEQAVAPALLEQALREGVPELDAWIGQAARCLRRAIVTVENLLDPETVVLGGTAPDLVLDTLMARIEPLPPGLGSRQDGAARRVRPRVVRATLGQDTPALGAAALALFDGMAPTVALLAKTPRAGLRRLQGSQGKTHGLG